MPLPFTIGTGRTLMWRHPQTQAAPGPVYLVRDQYTTTINPVVDAAAEPGPGTRDATGALWRIENAALRGGFQPTSPVWGNSKIVYDGQTRADGLTLWALVVPIDRDAELAVGWAATSTPTNPTTSGQHWINSAGYYRLGTPGLQVQLSGTGVGNTGSQRTIEYLVGVTLRATGAFYWISTFASYAALASHSTDAIGIPQFPNARVLWVDDVTTTTPMYPHISALTQVGPNGHFVDDLRVNLITDWGTDAGMATLLDRVTRADSTTSPGPGWTNQSGTFGVSSNKIYLQTNSGSANLASIESGLTGDGIWRCKVTAPTTPTQEFGIFYRRVDNSNYMILEHAGGNFLLWKRVAGTFTQLGSTTFTPVAGQVYDFCAISSGNRNQAYLDGVLKFDWTNDNAGSALTGGTGFGPFYGTVGGTGCRWDDFMAIPSIIALPTAIQDGATPHVFAVGSTIATDTFTAADATAISGRTTTTGGKVYTTVGSGWEINSNQARNTNINGAATDYLAYIDAGATDYEISVDITTPGVDDIIRAGVCVRVASANTFLFVRLFMDPSQVANDEIEVQEMLSGAAQGIVKQNLGNYFALSTTYTLKAQVVGRVLHVFLNGQPIITHIISVLTTGTGVGLYHSGGDDGSRFDNATWKALS